MYNENNNIHIKKYHKCYDLNFKIKIIVYYRFFRWQLKFPSTRFL